MQTRYGQNWWHKTRGFEGPQMSQDDAVALMSSPETVHIEVTDGERTTVVYAIGPDAGTVSWWRAGVLVQEHSLRPSAHHADELYAHKISVHHDGGARVVEWDIFPAYGVVSRQEHHYPAGEHDERTWHTMASADLDLLAVPGPIAPRDVRPLVDPARLEITDRLDSLPPAEFGPLPAGWASDTVTAPAVRTYGVRRVGESNALWGFVSAAEAERLHTHGSVGAWTSRSPGLAPPAAHGSPSTSPRTRSSSTGGTASTLSGGSVSTEPRRRPDCPGSRRPDGATRFSSVLPCGSLDATRHGPRVSSSPLMALRRSTAPATRTGRPCPRSPRESCT